jgi:RHS repeat-associated protein
MTNNLVIFGCKYDSLKFILTDNGRLLPNGTGYDYEYFIKDHPPGGGQVLGNTCVIVKDNNGSALVVQEDHYDPFGIVLSGQNTPNTIDADKKNDYLYNGKEFQNELGLDWYDYGARFYDAQLARFHSIDPLAENYSIQTPYAYAANNPVLFQDINGMGPVDVVKYKQHVPGNLTVKQLKPQ